jgi:hypothetical protein
MQRFPDVFLAENPLRKEDIATHTSQIRHKTHKKHLAFVVEYPTILRVLTIDTKNRNDAIRTNTST